MRTDAQAAGRDELGKVQQALEILDEAIAARMQSEAALRESEGVSASILAQCRRPSSVPMSVD